MGIFMCAHVVVSGHEQVCRYVCMMCVPTVSVCMQVFLHVAVSAAVCCAYMWNGCLCFHVFASCKFVLLCAYIISVDVPWSMLCSHVLMSMFLHVLVCVVLLPTAPVPAQRTGFISLDPI